MALGIYAGTTVNGMTALPSPVEVKQTNELIWSENTGRAQSGTNQAKMIGDVVAEKVTFAIKWGIITSAQMTTIKTNLPKGFFYFGMGTDLTSAKANAMKVYRSQIEYEVLPVGSTIYYKDANVSVIEQ